MAIESLKKAKGGDIVKIGHTGTTAYGKNEKERGTVPASYEQK